MRDGHAEQVDAYVGLGANQGDRIAALRGAVGAMAALENTAVVAVSSVWETEAHVLPGAAPQPDHLNGVAHLRTSLLPPALLAALHGIERAAGRDPEAPRWSPRPLDLDLLLWGDVLREDAADGHLVLPHPRIAARRFVLAPLAEVAPGAIVPGLGVAVGDLLLATPDGSEVRRTGWRLVG